MDIKLNLFNTFDNKAFNNAVKFFASDKRRELVTKFQDYCANVLARTFEHGDVKHANKLAVASEICGFGPTFRRVVVRNVPFAYDKESKLFAGSIQKGKRAALSELNADGIPTWEADLRLRFDGEGSAKDKKAPDYLKRYINALGAALKNGVTPEVLRTNLNAAIKQGVKDAETLSGDAQTAVLATKAQRKAA